MGQDDNTNGTSNGQAHDGEEIREEPSYLATGAVQADDEEHNPAQQAHAKLGHLLAALRNARSNPREVGHWLQRAELHAKGLREIIDEWATLDMAHDARADGGALAAGGETHRVHEHDHHPAS